MATTIHQPPRCETVEKNHKISDIRKELLWKVFFRDSSILFSNCQGHPILRHSDFKQKVTFEMLWMNTWGNQCWFHGELGYQDFYGESCNLSIFTTQTDSFITALRACTWSKDLITGTNIHHDLMQRGLLEKCSDDLVTMYATCGELKKAKTLFDKHKSKDIMAWTALISGYANEGQCQNALCLFDQMQSEDIIPNAVTYVCALKACAKIRAIQRGKQIHDKIARQGLLQTNMVLGGALVDMYAKCGAVMEARRVLKELPIRNAVTWNALIAGYAQESDPEQAVNCLEQMRHEGIFPNAVTYICALKACAMIRDVDRGKQIHKEVMRQGLLTDNIVLGGALVDMYAKCGNILEAQWVFDKLPSRDVVSWNALITGYSQEGEAEQALTCFEKMHYEGLLPNAVTYACALKACAMIKDADRGKQIHDDIARQGLLQHNVVLGGALVDMYAKCGAVSEARRVLGELSFRNAVTWNALIGGYAQVGEAKQVLNCIEQMQHEGILPTAVTYISTLKACAMIKAADSGQQIHQKIVREGLLQTDIALGNALVDMYVKCGAISKAQEVFNELPSRNVVSWNALIAGYAEGEAEQALKCLEEMRHEGILPDAVTYASALKACARIRAADMGKQIHVEIARQELLQSVIVLSGALVGMYAECGYISEAWQVFEKLPSWDVISWNALIAGYIHEGEAEQALNHSEQMHHESILPDAVTSVYVLKACALIKVANRRKEIHIKMGRQGWLQNDIVLGNALVDMYAKCGNVSEARWVLEKLPSRNVISWNALIAGYAQKGEAEEALNCLEQMKGEGILPNAVTCMCVLNVCSHQGLLEEGQALFVNMYSKYGLKPSVECYTSMIDLFGRAGHLEKAIKLIQEMPASAYMAAWHALLASCRKWADANVGGWAFEQVVNLDKSDGPAYVLMANLYAEAGMEDKVKNIEAMRNQKKACWINSGNGLHALEPAQNKCINTQLKVLVNKMSHNENFSLVSK